MSVQGHLRQGRANSKSGDVRYAAESGTTFKILAARCTEPVIGVMGEGDDKVLVEQAVDDVVQSLTAGRRLTFKSFPAQ